MTTKSKIITIVAIPLTLIAGWFIAHASDLLPYTLSNKITIFVMAIILWSVLITIILYKSNRIK
jgi:hypothetical protein